MPNRYLLLDCDGVLLNWLRGFKDYLYDTYSIELKGRPDNYSMEEWIGEDEEVIREYIREFNEESDSFGDLGPMPDAVFSMEYLCNEFKLDPVVITSCTDKPDRAEIRKENIKRHFPQVSEVHCVPLHSSKKEILQEYWENKYEIVPMWVEDNFDNAIDGLEAGYGGNVFFLDNKYNGTYEPYFPKTITYCKNWSDLTKRIMENEILSTARRKLALYSFKYGFRLQENRVGL